MLHGLTKASTYLLPQTNLRILLDLDDVEQLFYSLLQFVD